MFYVPNKYLLQNFQAPKLVAIIKSIVPIKFGTCNSFNQFRVTFDFTYGKNYMWCRLFRHIPLNFHFTLFQLYLVKILSLLVLIFYEKHLTHSDDGVKDEKSACPATLFHFFHFCRKIIYGFVSKHMQLVKKVTSFLFRVQYFLTLVLLAKLLNPFSINISERNINAEVYA